MRLVVLLQGPQRNQMLQKCGGVELKTQRHPEKTQEPSRKRFLSIGEGSGLRTGHSKLHVTRGA